MTLLYTDLVSKELKEHALKLTNDDNQIITYYISHEIGNTYLNRYYQSISGWEIIEQSIQINNLGHNKEEDEFIRSNFEKLDNILDIEFIELPTDQGSEIDIYSFNHPHP